MASPVQSRTSTVEGEVEDVSVVEDDVVVGAVRIVVCPPIELVFPVVAVEVDEVEDEEVAGDVEEDVVGGGVEVVVWPLVGVAVGVPEEVLVVEVAGTVG